MSPCLLVFTAFVGMLMLPFIWYFEPDVAQPRRRQHRA